MVLPTLAMFANLIFAKQANLRDTITFVAALLTFACVVAIAAKVGNTTTPQIVLFEVFANVPIAFNVEPLGLLFALVASGLWIVTHIYAIGYMRGNNESHHARFFGCFAGAPGCVRARM